MQLCHTHQQLLSRTLRWYSVGTSSDCLAASDVQVPPRLKRPVASTFGGINIQNVVVPTTQSASHNFRNNTKKPSWSNGSSDKSSDLRRMSQTERNKGMSRGGTSSMSGWGDGLVSLSFSNRLRLRQDGPSTRGSGTEPHPQRAQSQKQNSYQAQHPQMHGHRRGQRQQKHDDASQAHRRGHTETRKSATATTVRQGNQAPSTDAKTKKFNASSMTRPASSPTFKHQSKSTTAAAAAAKADTGSVPSPSNAPATQQPATASSDRKACLATLSSTNLNALFRTTTNTPTVGISTPSLPASTTASASDLARARVRSVLERSAGDYSRFLPRNVGVRKDASHLPALRAAHQALATQRDLSLEQRRVALHIIGGLVQPRREVGAS